MGRSVICVTTRLLAPKHKSTEPFAEGWNDNGYYLGRPVDVTQLPDGSLLVSDDLVGALYRIWYDGK
jgi:glucose/arabinose dehydrogenase